MLLHLDMGSEQPIYQQLRDQIVLGIGHGELSTGERLPTVRQLADDIGVNMMTVSKAYTILKQEGFIVIDRRHGATISPTAENAQALRERLHPGLSLLIAEARAKGLSENDFHAMCRELFAAMTGSSERGTTDA